MKDRRDWEAAVRRAKGLGVCVFALLLVVCGSAQAATPRKTADLFDSFGTNGHVAYYGEAYRDDNGTMVQRLKDAGIKHYRDAFNPGGQTDQYYFLNQILDAGVDVTLIVGPSWQWPANPDGSARTYGQVLDELKQQLPRVNTVEALNEYDCRSPDSYWVTIRDQTRDLAEAAHARGLKVISASLCFPGSWVSQQGDEWDLGNWADFANAHVYFQDANPPFPGDSQDYGEVGWAKTVAEHVTYGKPVYITESGFHTSDCSSYCDQLNGVTFRQQGTYGMTLWLQAFALGVQRTYGYEFVDQWDSIGDQEANWGMNDVACNADQSSCTFGPKKGWQIAAENWKALLGDTGTPTLTDLDYSVSDPAGTAKSYLFRKSDGSYWIALWNASNTGTRNVTVNAGSGSYTVYNPEDSTAPTVAEHSAGSQVVSLGNDPMLVKVGSGGSPPPSGDTTPPNTTITSGPANGSVTFSSSATFGFTGTDNVGVAGFECSLDGAAFAACASPKSYTNLSRTTHTFRVRARDAAGNVDPTPAQRQWRRR